MVLNLIGSLKSRGIGVVMISHNLTDVFQVADRIAVLYLGRLATVGPKSQFDTQSTVELMTTGTLSRNGSAGGPERAGAAGAQPGPAAGTTGEAP
jgi:ABC-type sugar transport system ATPase subunit